LNIKNQIRTYKFYGKNEDNQDYPSILWTGNGHHIYLPLTAIVLDHKSIFSRNRFPSLFGPTSHLLFLIHSQFSIVADNNDFIYIAIQWQL
jgi:hypothetical protein